MLAVLFLPRPILIPVDPAVHVERACLQVGVATTAGISNTDREHHFAACLTRLIRRGKEKDSVIVSIKVGDVGGRLGHRH